MHSIILKLYVASNIHVIFKLFTYVSKRFFSNESYFEEQYQVMNVAIKIREHIQHKVEII